MGDPTLRVEARAGMDVNSIPLLRGVIINNNDTALLYCITSGRMVKIRNSFGQILYGYVYLLPSTRPSTTHLTHWTYPTSTAATRYIPLTEFQYLNVSLSVVDSQ
jgi:hypothetical protein